MLRGMQLVLDPPVTVKFRTGIKDNTPTAQKLVPKLETWVSYTQFIVLQFTISSNVSYSGYWNGNSKCGGALLVGIPT
jgi:hypothetical protein